MLSTDHVVDAEAYTVKHVMYTPSDGETRGHYYRSDIEMGGIDTLCKLQFFKLSTQQMSVVHGWNGNICTLTSSKMIRWDGSYHLQLAEAYRHAYLNAIDEVCSSKPGIFIHLGGDGYRPSCDASKLSFL